MDQTLLTILIIVVVGLVGYLLGEWYAARRRQASATTAVTVSAGSAGETPPPLPSSPIIAAAAAAPKLPDLAHLDYEEDDEIDPTKVGAQASAPPTQRTIHQPPVNAIAFDKDAALPAPTHSESLFLVSGTAQTDKGLRRKRNEDSLCVLENLFIVADGMGGYAGGERASHLAVETIAGAYRDGNFEGPPHEGVAAEVTNLARAIQMSNATILEEAVKNSHLTGMGTTVCAASFTPNKRRLHIGHVGDSRCYRLRDGVFTQVTADHTMAELGVKGPEGQQLSRAVGIWPTVPIDVVMAVPRTGDVYLLCSDGLTKMLPDDVIANVLRHEEDPKLAVERLIFFANSRGGKDNITVVLVRVVPLDWEPKPSAPLSVSSGLPRS